MKLAVIGLGLIGGSMALDLKKNNFVEEIYGVDLSKEYQREALLLGLVDKVMSLEEACESADIIILSTPVGVVLDLLPKILDRLKEGQVVIDVGSTKFNICEAVKDHKKRSHFVATHPMAGTEFSGPKAAHLGLFKNKATVICDADFSDPVLIEKVYELYKCLEMRILLMSSKDHDIHAAYVSHLSHISSFVLANTVLDKEKNVNAIFNLASAGFESTVRLAKSSPEMWAPIFDQNQDNIVEALGEYIERLKLFHQSLKSGDFEETKKYMYRSNEIIRVLSQIKK